MNKGGKEGGMNEGGKAGGLNEKGREGRQAGRDEEGMREGRCLAPLKLVLGNFQKTSSSERSRSLFSEHSLRVHRDSRFVERLTQSRFSFKAYIEEDGR